MTWLAFRGTVVGFGNKGLIVKVKVATFFV